MAGPLYNVYWYVYQDHEIRLILYKSSLSSDLIQTKHLKYATSRAGSADTSGPPEFTSGFQWGSYCSLFYFCAQCLVDVDCPFVFFLLVIVLSVFRFTASNYPFSTFKFCLFVISLEICILHEPLPQEIQKSQQNCQLTIRNTLP